MDTLAKLKILYFWQAVGPSSWGRYASLYYDSVGLTPSQIGLITGAMPAVRALCMPAWGVVADRFSSKKRVALVTVSGGASTLLLLAIPGVAAPRRRPSAGRFGVVLAISVGAATFASSGVVDSYTLDTLEDKSRFGEIRLWSAISWGVSNVLMGWVADASGGFLVNLIFFAVCTCISVIILAVLIPNKTKVETAPPQPAKPLLSRLELCSLLAFLGELVVFGAAMGLTDRLLFIYIVEVLHGSYTLCGLTVLFTVAIEIPIFAVAKRLLAVLGHDIMFAIALLAYVPRVLGYTLLTPQTRHWILALELLHGPTFGLMFAASVDRASKLAPHGHAATYQTLQNAARACLGAALGASLGGYLWQSTCVKAGRKPSCRKGAVTTFRVFGAAVTLVLFLHVLAMVLHACRACCRRSPEESSIAPVAILEDDEDQNELLEAPLLIDDRSSGASSSSAATLTREEDAEVIT